MVWSRNIPTQNSILTYIENFLKDTRNYSVIATRKRKWTKTGMERRHHFKIYICVLLEFGVSHKLIKGQLGRKKIEEKKTLPRSHVSGRAKTGTWICLTTKPMLLIHLYLLFFATFSVVIMFCLFRKKMNPKEQKDLNAAKNILPYLKSADPKTACSHGPLTQMLSRQQQFVFF